MWAAAPPQPYLCLVCVHAGVQLLADRVWPNLTHLTLETRERTYHERVLSLCPDVIGAVLQKPVVCRRLTHLAVDLYQLVRTRRRRMRGRKGGGGEGGKGRKEREGGRKKRSKGSSTALTVLTTHCLPILHPPYPRTPAWT